MPSTVPYTRCDSAPSTHDRVHDAYVDPELGREGFTYVLESGDEIDIEARKREAR